MDSGKFELDRLLFEENQKKPEVNYPPMHYYVLLVRDEDNIFGTVLAKAESEDSAMKSYDAVMARHGWNAVSAFETDAQASLEHESESDEDLFCFPDSAVLDPKPWLGISLTD